MWWDAMCRQLPGKPCKMLLFHYWQMAAIHDQQRAGVLQLG